MGKTMKALILSTTILISTFTSTTVEAQDVYSSFINSAGIPMVCINSESECTGIQSESEGTGIQSESEGTGIQSESEGTGFQSESEGTGIQSESEGTGINGICFPA